MEKGVCDKGFFWNLGKCNCEYYKSCDFSEYLDYKNCKCREKLVDKLIEECTENIKEVRIAKITLAEVKNKYKYSSYILYIVLFSVIFTVNVGIGSYFLYFHWYLKEDVTRFTLGTHTQATI